MEHWQERFFIMHPLHVRLSKRWGGHENFAALATLTVCIALCVFPAVFVITSEGGVAQGVRRIEGVTGAAALDFLKARVNIAREIADAVSVPVIASGGVGTLQHLVEGVTEGHASAVLAASIFHFGTHTIAEAHEALRAAGLPARS